MDGRLGRLEFEAVRQIRLKRNEYGRLDGLDGFSS
jgi:hypothetical protein